MIADPLLEALGDQQAVAQPVMLQPREVLGADEIIARRAGAAAILGEARPEPELHQVLQGFRQILGDIALQRPGGGERLDAGKAVDRLDAALQRECPHAVHDREQAPLLQVDLARVLAVAEQDLVKEPDRGVELQDRPGEMRQEAAGIADAREQVAAQALEHRRIARHGGGVGQRRQIEEALAARARQPGIDVGTERTSRCAHCGLETIMLPGQRG